MVRRSIYNGTIWNSWYWSHCFLYIGSNTFINACGNGTMCVSASKLWDGDIYNYVILRVKGNPNISGVIDFALDKLGTPFDYTSLFLLTKQLDPSPNHYGYGYYCSEFIWASYLGGANIDLDPNGKGCITIWEIYTSDKVEKLYVDKPDDVGLRGLSLFLYLLCLIFNR